MPLKICPKCEKKCGPRTRVCACGHNFTLKSKPETHPLVPEPGGWVIDKFKGMPPIDPPEPLPAGKIDTELVRDYIAYDGLGFCIYTIIPVERIADTKLRRLWVAARDAMQKVQEYVYDVCDS